MRKINTRNFRLATRSTPRDVNRRIVLNLIREYQPISRAELARKNIHFQKPFLVTSHIF